jgi:hypothetical protein
LRIYGYNVTNLEICLMSTLEKLQAALDEMTSVLTNDFITTPVRESLEAIKTQIESAKTDLS